METWTDAVIMLTSSSSVACCATFPSPTPSPACALPPPRRAGSEHAFSAAVEEAPTDGRGYIMVMDDGGVTAPGYHGSNSSGSDVRTSGHGKHDGKARRTTTTTASSMPLFPVTAMCQHSLTSLGISGAAFSNNSNNSGGGRGRRGQSDSRKAGVGSSCGSGITFTALLASDDPSAAIAAVRTNGSGRLTLRTVSPVDGSPTTTMVAASIQRVMVPFTRHALLIVRWAACRGEDDVDADDDSGAGARSTAEHESGRGSFSDLSSSAADESRNRSDDDDEGADGDDAPPSHLTSMQLSPPTATRHHVNQHHHPHGHAHQVSEAGFRPSVSMHTYQQLRREQQQQQHAMPAGHPLVDTRSGTDGGGAGGGEGDVSMCPYGGAAAAAGAAPRGHSAKASATSSFMAQVKGRDVLAAGGGGGGGGGGGVGATFFPPLPGSDGAHAQRPLPPPPIVTAVDTAPIDVTDTHASSIGSPGVSSTGAPANPYAGMQVVSPGGRRGRSTAIDSGGAPRVALLLPQGSCGSTESGDASSFSDHNSRGAGDLPGTLPSPERLHHHQRQQQREGHHNASSSSVVRHGSTSSSKHTRGHTWDGLGGDATATAGHEGAGPSGGGAPGTRVADADDDDGDAMIDGVTPLTATTTTTAGRSRSRHRATMDTMLSTGGDGRISPPSPASTGSGPDLDAIRRGRSLFSGNGSVMVKGLDSAGIMMMTGGVDGREGGDGIMARTRRRSVSSKRRVTEGPGTGDDSGAECADATPNYSAHRGNGMASPIASPLATPKATDLRLPDGHAHRSLVDALRDSIKGRAHLLEPSLSRLKRAVLLVFAVLAITVIATTLVSVTMTNQLIAADRLVGRNGKRAVYIQRVFNNIQNAVLSSGEGKYNSDLFGNVTAVMEKVQSSLDLYIGVHRSLVAELMTSGLHDPSHVDERNLYVGPSITVSDLVPGSYVNQTSFAVTKRKIGLANAGIEFYQKANRALNSYGPAVQAVANGTATASNNNKQFRWNDTDVFYVLENGANAIRPAMNTSMMLAYARSGSQADRMEWAALYSMAVAEAVAVVVSLAVMVPAIASVVAAEGLVFNCLLAVPLPVVRALRARAVERMRSAAEENADVVSDAELGIQATTATGDDDDDDVDFADNDAFVSGSPTCTDTSALVPTKDDSRTNTRTLTGGGGGSGDAGMARTTTAASASSSWSRFMGGTQVKRIKAALTTTSKRRPSIGSYGSTGAADGALHINIKQEGDTNSHLRARQQQHVQSSGGFGTPISPSASPTAGLTAAIAAYANKRRLASASRRVYAHATSMAFSQRLSLLVFFLAPIVACMGALAGLYAWSSAVVRVARYGRDEVLWSRQAEFYVRQLNFRLRYGLAYCEQPWAGSVGLDASMAFLAFEETIVSSVLYGSAEQGRAMRPGAQVSPTTQHLFLVNGCAENGGQFYEMRDCATVAADTVSRGLLEGFRVYVALIRELINRRRAVLADPSTCVPADLNDPDVVLSYDLGMKYLAYGMQLAADAREDEAVGYLQGYANDSVTAAACSILLLAVLYGAWYRPMIRSLDTHMKDARHLPLLFPDQVARAVPAIVAVAGGGGGVAGDASKGLFLIAAAHAKHE